LSTQTTRIPITDLYRLALALDGALSPDGAQAVYELMRFTDEPREKRSTLVLAATDGSTSEALTDGGTLDSSPRFSPEGLQVAFLRKVEEKGQIHILDLATRQVRQVTSLPLGVGGAPAWSPDGMALAFTANPAASLPPTDQPYHLDRAIIRFDDVGYVHRSIQEIFVVGADGGNLRQVTAENALASNPMWSPDGTTLLYASTLAPTSLRISPTLKCVSLDGAVTTLVHDWGNVTTAAWMPDGKRVVFVGVPAGVPIGTQEQLWLVDATPEAAEGPAPMRVSVGFNFKIGGGLQADMAVRTTLRSPRLRVSEDGEWVYAQAQIGGTVQILRFALDGGGAREIVATGDRTCSLLDLQGDNVLFLASNLHDPVQVVVTSANDRLAGERVLTALNREVLEWWDRPEVEHMLYASVEKEAVQADERPLIASVYINRINGRCASEVGGNYLQADPTVQYAMGSEGNWWWKPTSVEEYARVQSPYNTYLNPGLPPGPIANPGASALNASRNPAATAFCFFLATGDDRRHIFAQTFAEHQQNMATYGYQP